ncbi:MAG: radical SAM protein [Candidatus Carbobacillus sp.]|nr:radical SAM protein [Bacteroidales bacterium]MDD4236431.1 radical SAM protein [Bacteroidales bacterium]MDY0322848.1 radical SAM protein [Candidatus Carbobacillus sp.]
MNTKGHNKNRVFLINLSTINFKKDNKLYMPQPHLGILCLKEISKNYNIDINVLDGDFNNLNDENILKKILKSKPKIIGFSPFQYTMERIIGLIKKIKSKLPNTIIILGGVHASITAIDILTDFDEIDYIIKGEAEVSFPKLILTILKIQQTNFTEIDGLVYRLNESIIENNASVFPDLDLLPNLGSQQIPFTNEISLVTSRGCVSNCSFCCTPYYMKLTGNSKYRYQSPEKVLKDITEIVQSSENKEISIYFPDSDFLGLNDKTIARVSKIADYILLNNIKIEIKLACQAKAIVKAGIEFWEKLKKAGLTMVFCGFESGSDEDLAYYNKSSNVNDALGAYKILSECNIGLHIGFIMFNPYSNKNKLLENINFLKKVDQLHIYGNISREVSAYPGTKIFHDLGIEKLLNYNKRYLTPQIKYKSNTIEDIKNAFCSYSPVQMLIDFMYYKFDFGLISGKKTIPCDKYSYKVDDNLRKSYIHYKNARANLIESYATKIINSFDENINDIGNKMNSALLEKHQEFLAHISTNIFYQTKKSKLSNTIFPFFKRKNINYTLI